MPENPTFAETAVELSNKDPKTFFTEELQLGIRGQYDVCLCSFLATRFRSIPSAQEAPVDNSSA